MNRNLTDIILEEGPTGRFIAGRLNTSSPTTTPEVYRLEEVALARGEFWPVREVKLMEVVALGR